MSIQGGYVSAAAAGALGNGSPTNALGLAGGGLQATDTFTTNRSVIASGSGNSIGVADAKAVTFSGAFTINAASTFAKTGAGSLTVGSTGLAASYGAGSALNVSGGTLNLMSGGGNNANRNLAVTVNNATLAVGRTQYLASLTLTSRARASINAVGTGNTSSTIKTDVLRIDSTSLLNLKDNNLIVNYTGGGTGTLTALVNLIKSGGGTKSDSIHYDWNGTSGITSSSVTLTDTGTYSNQYTSLGIRDYGYDLCNRPAPATLEGVEIETNTARDGVGRRQVHLDGRHGPGRQGHRERLQPVHTLLLQQSDEHGRHHLDDGRLQL